MILKKIITEKISKGYTGIKYLIVATLKKDTETKIPRPFILTGWWGTNMEDKRQSFLEQIDICISLQIEDEVLNFLNNYCLTTCKARQ